jgi:hypothetical protein
VVVAAGALLVGAAGTATTTASADDSNGLAIVWLYSGDQTIEWGQSVHVYGYVDDESTSCLTVPMVCDTPTGTITLSGANHTIAYGSGPVESPFDDPSANYANYDITIPYDKFDPGIRYVVIDYAGNFDPYTTYFKVTVNKQACHSFSLEQSASGSKPGDPVTFTADLGHDGHQGTLTIFDASGILASGSPEGGRSLSTTTSALAQGDTPLYATYSGDGFHEGCTSSTIHHVVSADAIPTARDDTASTDVGSPVTIPVLANDEDDNPGIRPEVVTNPDVGDFEKVGDSYVYTPDPDMGNYQDAFDYIDYDSIGQSSAPAHVVINVGCTPNARDDGYAVRQLSTLTVPATSGAQANDDTCDSPVSLASDVAHGTLALADDGSFTYRADDDFTGTDHFTYQYTDQLETPVTARVDLQVVPLQAPSTPGLPPGETTTTTSSTTTSTSTTTTTTTSSTTSSTTTTSTTTTAPTTTTTSTTTTTPTTTTTTTAPPPTAGTVALGSLYDRLFDRAPDPSGLAHWVPLLDGGTPAGDIARSLVDSAEFDRRLVAEAYRRCLDRPADPAGLAYWAGRLDGLGPDGLRASLLGSEESWRRAHQDPSGWTDLVFEALLGRGATPDEHAVVDDAVPDAAHRTEAADRVARFAEARRHLAEVWYPIVAGRAPTADESAAWAAAMASGRSERALIAQLAASLVTAPD